MAKIKPFKSIRPKKGLEKRIAALPYDVYSRQEAAEKVKGDDLTFLRIDRPETQFPPGEDMYAPKVYEKARELLWQMTKDGSYIQDPGEYYYLYELTMDSRSQTGLVACASVDDYENQVIKKHENTRTEKEQDRIRHVDTCGAQTGPIFLAYRSDEAIEELVRNRKKEAPEYDFVSEDGIRHRVWVIKDAEEIKQITNRFAKIENLYIADGHHRAASAVKVGLKRRAEKPDFDGSEEFNYFLSVLFPDSELMIMDYNRVVHDLNGNTEEEFLEKLGRICEVKAVDDAYHPKKKGEVGLYLNHRWYQLTFKEEFQSEDPVDGLDVSILQKEILQSILGIEDPKTSDRIEFIGGIRGLEELERRVNEGCAAAFAMYPTNISELFAVADANRLMPPKSTWFEPKLRSGIFIHKIDE